MLKHILQNSSIYYYSMYKTLHVLYSLAQHHRCYAYTRHSYAMSYTSFKQKSISSICLINNSTALVLCLQKATSLGNKRCRSMMQLVVASLGLVMLWPYTTNSCLLASSLWCVSTPLNKKLASHKIGTVLYKQHTFRNHQA